MRKLAEDANVGGSIAGEARVKIEKKLGRSIVSKHNFKNLPSSKKIKG